MSDNTFTKSTFYEQLVEHVFISDILQEVWYSFNQTVEVLRSEIDASGYDVALECNGILRHVQLKTSRSEGKTASQKVHTALAKKPSGCVVWLVRHEDADTRRMKLTYLFLGGAPGQPLALSEKLKAARHTKPNMQGIKTDRPNLRVVPKSQFQRIGTTQELVERLFGKLRFEQ